MRHLVLQNGRSPQANLSIQDFITEAIGIFKDQAAVDAYPHWAGARPGILFSKM